jgi:hypothetical protein
MLGLVLAIAMPALDREQARSMVLGCTSNKNFLNNVHPSGASPMSRNYLISGNKKAGTFVPAKSLTTC